MEISILEALGKIAGVGGVSLGVVALVFRDVIRKNIFPSLTNPQAYRVIQQILWLTVLLAATGLASWVYVESHSKNSMVTNQEFSETRNESPESSNRNFSKPISAENYLSIYSGDGDVHYDSYELSEYPELKKTLEEVNLGRIEFPQRAIDISLIQDYLSSGDLDMAYFAASELVKKQRNLRKMKR